MDSVSIPYLTFQISFNFGDSSKNTATMDFLDHFWEKKPQTFVTGFDPVRKRKNFIV